MWSCNITLSDVYSAKAPNIWQVFPCLCKVSISNTIFPIPGIPKWLHLSLRPIQILAKLVISVFCAAIYKTSWTIPGNTAAFSSANLLIFFINFSSPHKGRKFSLQDCPHNTFFQSSSFPKHYFVKVKGGYIFGHCNAAQNKSRFILALIQEHEKSVVITITKPGGISIKGYL